MSARVCVWFRANVLSSMLMNVIWASQPKNMHSASYFHCQVNKYNGLMLTIYAFYAFGVFIYIFTNSEGLYLDTNFWNIQQNIADS